jgi:phage-related protein
MEFYETADDKKPVEKFMIDMGNKMRTKAIRELMVLRLKGNELREPYSKFIEDGVFELRIQQGSDDSRVFYFFYVDSKIILTNGFIKKTQKAPPAEIARAKRYKADYERRHHG